MKRKYVAVLMGFVFLVTLGAGSILAGDMDQGSPTVVVSPGVAALDSKSQIVILGSGFQASQKLSIMFEDSYGALTEIMEVEANEQGTWAVVWTLDRYTRQGILKTGTLSLLVADQQFKPLASAPLALVDVTEDPKKWPEYGKAAGLKPKKKKKKK